VYHTAEVWGIGSDVLNLIKSTNTPNVSDEVTDLIHSQEPNWHPVLPTAASHPV
jgi:hypothetical protein